MRTLSLLCLVLLAGCASAPPPTFPPMPKAAAASFQIRQPMVSTPPAREWLLPIAYGVADPENYTWTLQQSGDSKTWTNLFTFSKKGPPTGDYTIYMGTNRLLFWRMKGIK